MWEKVRHKAWYIYAYLVARRFHAAYYATPTTWEHMDYFGHRIYQYPGDMWLYQEIIVREQPAYIIQTGVAQGGSLLYFAHMLDLLGAAPEALVVGIDIHLSAQARQMTHPRIRLIAGDSIDPLTVEQVAAFLPPGEGMVSLDSAHTYEHVLREIELYQQFVRVGSYLVVEDTNLNGHPVWKAYGAGPYEAVQRFLSTNEQFIRDDEIWRRNLFSFHQYGWLRRVR